MFSWIAPSLITMPFRELHVSTMAKYISFQEVTFLNLKWHPTQDEWTYYM